MPKGYAPKPKGKDSVHFVHGGSIRDELNHQKPIYRTWVQMRQRCNNPKMPDYHYYGGRGIKHCERWNIFQNFYDDMNASFEEHKQKHPSTTLERMDVNAGYSPENCRWATRKEQSNNRNFNHLITYNGRTQSVAMWADELPIKTTAQNLHHRLLRGWSVERAFTQELNLR